MNDIDKLVLDLIELKCPILKHDSNFSIIYKDNTIHFDDFNYTLIWINREHYKISSETHDELLKYYRKEKSIEKLISEVALDMRYRKLKKLNEI
jgi:hypothetical protein